MAKPKRKNPCRIPLSAADLHKAKVKATNDAITQVWALFLTVMRDKEGYGKTRLNRVWGEVNYLADSVTEGRVSFEDLIKTIEDEAGIRLRNKGD